MNTVTVSKEIDDEVKVYTVECGPDKTVYLKDGETVVDNPNNLKIHHPAERSHMKTMLAIILLGSMIAIGIAGAVSFLTAQ